MNGVDPERDDQRDDQPSALHHQLHELFAVVAACEADWALDERIALSLRLQSK